MPKTTEEEAAPIGRLKLYRGVSSDESILLSKETLIENRKAWESILKNRLNGKMVYPLDLDETIKILHKKLRLERHYFTDSRKIAEGYAKKFGGILVELSVPLKDVFRYFELDFQNFSRRKKHFEFVYCLRGGILSKHHKKWNLKVESKQ